MIFLTYHALECKEIYLKCTWYYLVALLDLFNKTKKMKIRFGFLTLTALVVCKAHAYDLMSKIFHNSRGMNLNPDSADKDCVEKCHVLSDVLKEVAELKEKVNLSSLTVSQTIDQMSQTMSQLSQTVGQLSQTVDQPRQGDDQQNNRKGRRQLYIRKGLFDFLGGGC